MVEAFRDIVARRAAGLPAAASVRASVAADLPRIGLEQRARAVTALVRFGWNGASLTPPLAKPSEIVAPERLQAGVVFIGHPSAASGVGEALRGTARALRTANVPKW